MIPHIENRLTSVFVVLIILLAGVCGRLAWVTFSGPSPSVQKVSGVTLVSPAYRSRTKILDRHGRLIATSMESRELYVNPSQIDHPEETFEKLAAIFPHLNRETLLPHLRNKALKEFRVKKYLSPQEVQALTSTNIILSASFKRKFIRRYPHGSLYGSSDWIDQ